VFDSIHLLNFEITQRYGQFKYKYVQLVRDRDQRWAFCVLRFHACWIIAGPFEQPLRINRYPWSSHLDGGKLLINFGQHKQLTVCV
jgi:hypothetical protein